METQPEIAAELTCWAKTLRIDAIEMIRDAGSGHPGGSLSAAEIVACLFFHHMRLDPTRPTWEDRDRFILSKGHACPILYAALAEKGYFPKETLSTLRRLGSKLQGHPDMKKTPGVDMTSGSLGQGLSAGVGMALGGRLDGKDFRVYVLLGCGEVQEGQVWEAAMAASHYKLNNLVAIVDYNGLQVDGKTCEIMDIEPLSEKWHAFGWQTLRIDGHSIPEILEALGRARTQELGPTAIIAATTKGKGVSFMENVALWHGKAPSPAEAERAVAELEEG